MRHIRREELRELARLAGFSLADDEVGEFLILSESMFEALDRVERMAGPENVVVKGVTRDAGRVPTPDEDPLNAITRWCSVRAAEPDGPLKGVKVAVKDMIPIAGIPMTFGSSVLRGFMAEEDCVLARRLLGSGAEIVAVTNMEAFAFSGGGETCSYGPVRNPFDRDRTACGSSNGSAAALYYDDIDLAWGTDTGGSIRIPSSWCGTIGLKATHGLFDFGGIPTTDARFDHVGPMARSIEMIALALDAVAVPQRDPTDPLFDRDSAAVAKRLEKPDYMALLQGAPANLAGLRIGVVRESLERSLSAGAPRGSVETIDAFRQAMGRFGELGATVEEVSIPLFSAASDVMFTAMAESATAAALGWPTLYTWFGDCSPKLVGGFRSGLSQFSDELPATFKLVMLLGVYLNRQYGGAVSARAHRMIPIIANAIDRALDQYDLLAMPTTTHYAHLVEEGASISERALRGWDMLSNAPAFNASGHPAISLPAAEADGLPVGVMLAARRLGEGQLITVGRTYERAFGWLPAQSPAFRSRLNR